MIKAVLTVIGCDRVGIIAAITGYLAQVNVNVLDISQTIMDDIFTMVMLVDVSAASENFNNIAGKIKKWVRSSDFRCSFSTWTYLIPCIKYKVVEGCSYLQTKLRRQSE